MGAVIEIYALCCPDTGRIRYIGKSVNSKKRLTQHLAETRRNYPVYSWIKKLRLENKIPVLKIIDYATVDNWQEKEMFHISTNEDLLNLAEGGDQPGYNKQILADNGRKVAATIHSDPLKRKIWYLKKRIADSLFFFKKNGNSTSYNRIVDKLHLVSKLNPVVFGKYSSLTHI